MREKNKLIKLMPNLMPFVELLFHESNFNGSLSCRSLHILNFCLLQLVFYLVENDAVLDIAGPIGVLERVERLHEVAIRRGDAGDHQSPTVA